MFGKLLLIYGLSCAFITSVCCVPDPASINETIPNKYFNLPLQHQNPSSVSPPPTDEGGQNPFKYPFAFAQLSTYSGGWVRQATVRDFPISTKMAGVQMRLIRGGVRELHWHVSSEWAYVIYGKVRITAVEQHGRASVEDVNAGDLWYFPGGVPHSLEGIGADGAFFLLAFDDGNFSAFETFLLTDWMNHIPKDVLAKNFQTSPSTFNNLPTEKLYIFPSQLTQPLQVVRAEVNMDINCVSQSLVCFGSKMEPNVTRTGGEVKIIDKNNFPATNIAAAIVTLKPGAMRELHWHPNDDEWQYYIEGQARMSVFNGNGQARTMDFQAGDIGYVSKSLGHYIENTGNKDVVFLEVFPTPYYQDISLAEWLANTPNTLVNNHIHTGVNFINSINKNKTAIEP